MTLFPLPSWMHYSRKLISRIDNPRNAGCFTLADAESHEMRLIIGQQRVAAMRVALYWLIDENDGVIADAKFQLFGPPALIGAADAACELVVRKSYVQALRITADLLDMHLRYKSEVPAFPQEASCVLNLVLDAILHAAEQCGDIPYHDVYVAPPIAARVEGAMTYPQWDTLSVQEQTFLVEEVIAQEIRPYIELDAGGVEVLNVVQGREILIAYKGSCTSCYSSTGATLNAIQETLRSKIHPELQVTPV